MELQHLMDALGYSFNDVTLLEAALTHRSYAHERGIQGFIVNERLEFLGDALLNFVSGTFLFHMYPERGEGDLTTMRSQLVQTRTLAMLSRRLTIDLHVRISKGEERAGGRRRDNLLADTFEAVLAAIALDGGWEAARQVVEPLLRQELLHISTGKSHATDYKTLLQQRIQALSGITPVYKESAVSGPDHNRQWTIEVWADSIYLSQGIGSSKQQASQMAARKALDVLDGPDAPNLPDHPSQAQGSA